MELKVLAENFDLSGGGNFESEWVYLGDRKFWSMALSVPVASSGEWRVETWNSGIEFDANNNPITGTLLANFNPDPTGRDVLSDNNVSYTHVRIVYVNPGSAGSLKCSMVIKDN